MNDQTTLTTTDPDSNVTCPKCGAALVEGIALTNTIVGSGDLLGGTFSFSGPAEIVGCRKCPECGYSEQTIKLK